MTRVTIDIEEEGEITHHKVYIGESPDATKGEKQRAEFVRDGVMFLLKRLKEHAEAKK